MFLRFDALNQIVYDEAEPAAVLLSCRDGRKYFVAFQSAEDCLVFRWVTGCVGGVFGVCGSVWVCGGSGGGQARVRGWRAMGRDKRNKPGAGASGMFAC